ncbi:hypothetical protein POTOM_059289 [Populus tomentosa]|uniref:Uncharacterized protein n=1 Tax=Populus tomentosa TaxID=118781 RepID=A0A8X7XTE3_POPTO|nr:hypothetical protein POTOM_059289 [Populus tomentosa]
MPKLTFRDTRTFAEALSVTKHPKKTVMYESIPDGKEWLQRSLVGFIATDMDYAHLEHMVLKNVKQIVGCIESIIEKAGKMLGYDITSVSQGSLTEVKVLLSTTSFETLNEHVLLVLDGVEFEISIMEMKPDFSPLLSIIKHSMGATGIQTLDEELCSEFTASDEVTAAATKITDTDGDHCATDITLTQQQKADTDSDFSLILYQGYTGPTNNLDHTDTSSKIACLFPETKETCDPQMKYQQLHSATYQTPSTMSHDNKLKENTQEATDSDSSTDVSAHSVTRVGLVKTASQAR